MSKSTKENTAITEAICPLYIKGTLEFKAIEVPSCKDITEKYTEDVLIQYPDVTRYPFWLLRNNQWNLLKRTSRKNKPWFVALETKPSSSKTRVELTNIINPEIIKKIQKAFPNGILNEMLLDHVDQMEVIKKEVEIKKVAKAKTETKKETPNLNSSFATSPAPKATKKTSKKVAKKTSKKS